MVDSSKFLSYLVDIRVPLIIFAVIFTIFTPILSLVEGMSLLDALYFTVITITTIGFGDIVITTPLGKIISLLMILSTILVMISLVMSILYYVRLGMHYENHMSNK